MNYFEYIGKSICDFTVNTYIVNNAKFKKVRINTFFLNNKYISITYIYIHHIFPIILLQIHKGGHK